MIEEIYYSPAPAQDYKIEIAPAPADGRRYPVVVVLHGNFGMGDPFGKPLRDFSREIADLGYLAALPHYYADDERHMTDGDVFGKLPALAAAIAHLRARDDADPARLGLVGFSLGGGV